MHFSKTYTQLLLTLPPELQENAIEYRQLKKLINEVVNELSSLGLSPAVLHDLLQSDAAVGKGKQRATGERPEDSTSNKNKAVYEIVRDGDKLEPRLRLWVGTTNDPVAFDGHEGGTEEVDDPKAAPRVAIFLDKPELDSNPPSPITEISESGEIFEKKNNDLLLVSKPLESQEGHSLVWTLQKKARSQAGSTEITTNDDWKSLGSTNDSEDSLPQPHPVELVKDKVKLRQDGTREIIIPLSSDTAFFELLRSALESLAAKLLIVRNNFVENLEQLSVSISHTARPVSETSRHFTAFHPGTDPLSITAPLLSPFSSAHIPGGSSKSDLYAWREIFQLYIDSDVFESQSERTRGELSIAETEKRLASFAERVTGRGLSDSRKLKLKESRTALEKFLELNVFILNLKKFQYANTEAARKILKKHAKRTALPFILPSPDVCAVNANGQLVKQSQARPITQDDILSLIPAIAIKLPHLMVQAIGEIVLPVIPSLDDYNCLICYNIAFKPIRLACGHLFCVRCLIKMQKRNQNHCPCCRAPTVLRADRSNVDWALINFMRDWFPKETNEKMRQNEREAAREELEEMGIQDSSCIVV